MSKVHFYPQPETNINPDPHLVLSRLLQSDIMLQKKEKKKHQFSGLLLQPGFTRIYVEKNTECRQ